MKDSALHLKKLFYYPYVPSVYLTIQDGMRAVIINSNWFDYFHIIGTGFQKFKWNKSPKTYQYGDTTCKQLQVVSSINCNKITSKMIMIMISKTINSLSSITENGSYRVIFGGNDLNIIEGPAETNTHLSPYIQNYFKEYKNSLNDIEPINMEYKKIMNNVDLYDVYRKMREVLLKNNTEIYFDDKKITTLDFSTSVSNKSEKSFITAELIGEAFPISFYSVNELSGQITFKEIITTKMVFL